MNPATILAILITTTALFAGYKILVRLRLSRAKQPGLSGHARWSRRFAKLVPYFEYDADHFYCCDGAPVEIVAQRKLGFARLSMRLRDQAPKSIAFGQSLEDSISDVHFINSYRVPFPFRKIVSSQLHLGTVVTESAGVQTRDLDGNWNYDLTGAYGVNVFGYDFYKQCMERAWEQVGKQVGPVLGPYHPVICDNVARLKAISGLDEVSFHMSGTEAVMQAVRMAPLSHRQEPSGDALRCLSRLVGWRANRASAVSAKPVMSTCYAICMRQQSAYWKRATILPAY